MRRLVSYHLAAHVTAMYDDVSLLGIGLCLDGAENAAAGIGSVTGVYINVQRAKAKRAVISRGVSKW